MTEMEQRLTDMGFKHRPNSDVTMWSNGSTHIFVRSCREFSAWVGTRSDRFRTLDEAIAWIAITKLTGQS